MTNDVSSGPIDAVRSLADRWSLHEKRMKVAHCADGAVIDRDTIFVFSENEGMFSASYRGGGIRLGYLVGARRENRAEFRYAQMTVSGVLDGGVSHCELVESPDGRLRLVEHFQWESRGGSGTNVLEEILEGEA